MGVAPQPCDAIAVAVHVGLLCLGGGAAEGCTFGLSGWCVGAWHHTPTGRGPLQGVGVG